MARKQMVTLVTAGIFLAGCGNQPQSSATDSPGRGGFQAELTHPSGGLFAKQKFSCDGKGHYRIESFSTSPTVLAPVVVLDESKNEVLQWVPNGPAKQYLRKKAEPTDYICIFVGSMRAKMQNPIGTKVIDGHACHGYKGSDGSVLWSDDKYKIPVLASDSNGTPAIQLTALIEQTPPSSLFQPPADYTPVADASGIQAPGWQVKENH